MISGFRVQAVMSYDNRFSKAAEEDMCRFATTFET